MGNQNFSNSNLQKLHIKQYKFIGEKPYNFKTNNDMQF